MGHHDAVAAVRRRGRLQEPVESLLLILLRAPAEPGMPELIVHVVRLPAGGLAGAGHLQTDEVAVVGDARVGSQRDEVVVPLALLSCCCRYALTSSTGPRSGRAGCLAGEASTAGAARLPPGVGGWHGGERAAAA